MRKLALVFGILGWLVFGTLFALSYAKPTFVEQTTKDAIRYRLQTLTQGKIDSLDDYVLIGHARSLLGSQAGELERLKQLLADKLPEKLSAVIAQMRNLDCECRRITEERIRDSMNWRIASLTQMQQQLTSFIQVKYMDTVAQLVREFRIFTGSNSLVFLLLVVAALVRRRAKIQLLLPVIVLTLAAGMAAYLYLFQQNWLHTILFSSYVGWFYLVYIGIIFALLCDIIFNRCRVINGILSGIHIEVSPC